MSPKGQVKSAKDEQRWNSCKKSVAKAHPDMSNDSDDFWAMVNGCYQRKKGTILTDKE